MCKWILWDAQPPREDEAWTVLFYDRFDGEYWLNRRGSIVSGSHCHDQMPIAWTQKPEIPDVEEMKAAAATR